MKVELSSLPAIHQEAESLVHGLRIAEDLGHIRCEDDDIAPFGEASRVLTALTLAESGIVMDSGSPKGEHQHDHQPPPPPNRLEPALHQLKA